LLSTVNVAICAGICDSVVTQHVGQHTGEPGISSIGGEWTVVGLARSGEAVDQDYFDTYYDNVRATVKSSKGVLSDTHYTEYARVAIAVAAIGKDSTNIEGYNILEPLDDYETVTSQGMNGSAYALIAAKVNNYELKNEKKYIEHILSQELKNGGFSYSPKDERASADMTAIAIQALAMYPEYHEAEEVVQDSINVLAEIQNDDGLFNDDGFDPSSESVSQVIIALIEAGVNPITDERFIKDERTLQDVLMDFSCDNGFCHVIGDGGNLFATEQAMMALDALLLMEEGSCLYAF
jgi:hypothetical protein